MSDWRSDPGWRLVEHDPNVYPDPTRIQKPTATAELAQPPLWASEYRREHRAPVATWFREQPIDEKVRQQLARKAARRTGVDADHPNR